MQSTENSLQRKTLTNVLTQSERVKTLVKESAEELSSVNEGIKEKLTNHGPMPGVGKCA